MIIIIISCMFLPPPCAIPGVSEISTVPQRGMQKGDPKGDPRETILLRVLSGLKVNQEWL